MTDAPPRSSQLEHTLGRLVEAGVDDPVALAGLLGLEPRHIGRPLRRLALTRVLDSDAAGGLQLTPYGRDWLGVTVSADEGPSVAVSDGPRLDPLHTDSPTLAIDEDPELDVPVARDSGWKPRLPRLRLVVPRFRVTLAGAQLSASAGRRIAAGVAAVLVLMLGAQVGLRVAGSRIGGHLSAAAEPAPQTAPRAAAPAPGAAPPQPAAAVPPERWVVVEHTNGLGLVLRPAPASPERVLTLEEGARVRVTGDPVQQGGRAWLPVAVPTGKIGWVADDFVAPVP